MNVYDFDDTIFRGDSTRAFWAYCLKRAPGLARFLPRQCAAAVRYALGRTAKEAFKEAFFSFLQGVPDADAWPRSSRTTWSFLPHRNFCWRPPAAGWVSARPSPPV